MRIFITGASGFLGSHLVPLLQKGKKHQMLLLSRTIEDSIHIKGDIGNIDAWKDKVERFKPDAAIHLAWEGVATYNTSPPDIALKNIVNSVNLTSFLGQIGCKRFVALGSATDFSKNLTPFAVTKVAFRVLGEATAAQSGMVFFWTSPSYIYGPGQREEALLPYAINSLLKGVKPEIKNPGLRQDFIYVSDVARALKLILEKGEKKTGWYQIGSGKAFLVGNLLNIAYGKLGLREPYKKQKTADFGKVLAPQIANIDALKRLGWRPEVTLEKGVANTVNYYRKNLL